MCKHCKHDQVQTNHWQRHTDKRRIQQTFFTILDFRNATDLFADRDFDGDPIRIKPVTEDTDLITIVDEEENDNTPIVDEISGDEIKVEKPQIRYPENDLVSTVHEPKN